MRRLLSSVWWPSIVTDIVNYIAGCLQYMRNRPPKSAAPDLPTDISAPSQLIGMDYVGPFPPSKDGNLYLLVIIDYFSRYV